MKRFIVAAILVGVPVALVGGTALAAGLTTLPGRGFGPGFGAETTDTAPVAALASAARCGAGGALAGGRV